MKHLTHLKTSMIVGLVATFVMTLAALSSHHIRIPNPDFHGLITALFNTGAMDTWIVYFGLGMAAAHFYGTHIKSHLPYSGYRRGMVYGICLWLFTAALVMPMAGMAAFGGSMMATVGLLFAMVSYGATLGYLYDR